MASVCFYFQVHQPFRIKRLKIFDVGQVDNYFDDQSDTDLNNARILAKVARKCYLPTNELMLSLLKDHPEFKISFSLSGVFIDQLERFAPDVLDSFKRLAETGQVEFLNETYYHSLAFLHSPGEYRKQIDLHRNKIQELFGISSKVFRNTELIYNNDIAEVVAGLGYEAILAEGADHLLTWRSPNFVYQSSGEHGLKLLLKNYKLSDDIAFRFSSRDWSEYPLSADKFSNWISQVNGNGDVVNLFMDYETFGEHQWEDSGIFRFLADLPGKILAHPDNNFVTPSEAIDRYPVRGEIDSPHYVSWADVERDLSAWSSNDMQFDALQKVYALEEKVLASGDDELINNWRYLQTSDHFYYMCTKWFNDGDVHKYFNPYESPYDAYISFVNAVNDLQLKLA